MKVRNLSNDDLNSDVNFFRRIKLASDIWRNILKPVFGKKTRKKIRIEISYPKRIIFVFVAEEVKIHFSEFFGHADFASQLRLLRPKVFQVKKKYVYLRDEPGISLMSLLLKKAKNKLLKDNPEYQLMKRVRRIIKYLPGCSKYEVRTQRTRSGRFKCSIKFSIDNKIESKTLIPSLVFLGDKNDIIKMVENYFKGAK